MLDRLRELMDADQGEIVGAYKTSFFTANLFAAGRNYWLSRHLTMTANVFEPPINEDLGTAIAKFATYVGNQGTGSGQCIPLTPSGTYEVGTHVRFPSGQAALGFGAAAVGWFDNTTCAGTPLATVNAPPVASTTTNTWVESFMSGLTAPAGTVAVAAGVGVLKIGAGGSLAGLFDRVRFGPTGTTPVTAESFTVE